MRVLLAAAIAWTPAARPASAEPTQDMCPRGKVYRGTPIDLDVKNAELGDVLQLLADVGRVNIVIASDVAGKATLRLRRVPWDQVVCTVAASHRLEVLVDGNVVVVRRR